MVLELLGCILDLMCCKLQTSKPRLAPLHYSINPVFKDKSVIKYYEKKAMTKIFLNSQ